MVNWLVFGGWAIKPDILRPIFGKNSVYIDSNTIVPLLLEDDILLADWQQRVVDIILSDPTLPKRPLGIAGWSTGAMLAWAVAERLKPAAGVFFSATPSFCRRRASGFLSGQRSSVLKSMRDRVLIDPESVVNAFYAQCGISAGQSAPFSNQHANGFSAEQLISGLHFLEQASLLPLHQASFPALFLHGKEDSIIPIDAGRYFCKEAGGTFAEFEGPHAFFRDSPDEPGRTISDFLQKVL